MNKAAIYISLLAIFILALIYITGPKEEHDVIYHSAGFEYVTIDSHDIPDKIRKDLMLLVRNPFNHTTELYHVGSYRGHSEYDVYRSAGPFDEDISSEIFTDAMQGHIIYDDTLRVGKYWIQSLTRGAVNVDVVRFLDYDAFQDHLTFNERKYLILFGLPLLWIIFLLINELIIYVGKRLLKKRIEVVLRSILVVLLCILLTIGFPSVNLIHFELIGFYILILPVFIVYQMIFFLRKTALTFVDKEALKFVVLIVGLTVSSFGAEPFQVLLEGYERLETLARLQYHLAFAFIIAFGNLIFNILKYLISLIGSDKKLKQANQKVLQQSSALNTLESSVNPHFLYNSLNSIAELVNEDADKAQKMTLGLSKFYKYVTNRDESPLSTIGEEIEIVNTYLDIEKIRFEERLTYKIVCKEDVYNVTIPFFIMQPLAENAIKYGYNNDTDKIEIEIHIQANEKYITVKIFDSGIAFDEAIGKGFGLKSVSTKLKYHYPSSHEMAFINHPSKHLLIEIKR